MVILNFLISAKSNLLAYETAEVRLLVRDVQEMRLAIEVRQERSLLWNLFWFLANQITLKRLTNAAFITVLTLGLEHF